MTAYALVTAGLIWLAALTATTAAEAGRLVAVTPAMVFFAVTLGAVVARSFGRGGECWSVQ